MNWSNIKSKLVHAVIVAAGTGAGIIVTAATGGTALVALPLSLAGKAAGAAFVAYMLKSARPEVK